jgi:hypothetical protein
MDFLGGALGAIGNIVGGGMQIHANKKMQKRQFEFDAAQAEIGRDWQTERMEDAQTYNSAEALATRKFNRAESSRQRRWTANQTNTAYQRATEDMKAAGLNPMLAYSQGGAQTGSGAGAQGGSAASSPGGGSAPVGHGSGGHSAPDFSRLGSSAVQIMDMIADIGNKIKTGKLIESQAANQDAQTQLTYHSAGELDARAAKLKEEISEVQARVRNLDQQTKTGISQEQLNKAHKLLAEAQRISESGRPGLINAEKRLKQAEAILAEKDEPQHSFIGDIATRGMRGTTAIDSLIEHTAERFFRFFDKQYNPNGK